MADYQILIQFLNKSIHFLIKRNAISSSWQNTTSYIQDNTIMGFFFKHKACRFYSDLKQHYYFYFSWYLSLISMERNQSPDINSVQTCIIATILHEYGQITVGRDGPAFPSYLTGSRRATQTLRAGRSQSFA